MIHYQLRCAQDHAFDGWFRDSDGFDEQAANGLLSCPACADTAVRRAPMAPRIASRAKVKPAPLAEKALAAPPGSNGPNLPAAAVALLQRMRADIERTCDYVGADFAASARRIHDGETPARAIYGEATADQAEALRDDGIEIANIPWLPRADS